MSVRLATAADLPDLEALWRAFEAELPPPLHEDVDRAVELAQIREIVAAGLGWLAEVDGAAVGMVLARRRGSRVGRITDIYVRPAHRRTDVAADYDVTENSDRARVHGFRSAYVFDGLSRDSDHENGLDAR